MRALRFAEDPLFHATFFRRTKEALTKPGSLWPEARKIYQPFGAHIKERDKEIVFPSGAVLKFDGLQLEHDVIDKYQGSQLAMVAFDEATHFEPSQFLYMLGRLRSEADINPHVFLTANPDPDTWLLEWVRWWLDDEGYPDPEKQGIIRYFVVKEERPIFADTSEELEELYPELCEVADPLTGEMKKTPPKSITFCSATIFDNPILISTNPGYLSNLQSQSDVNRARLLHGNWFIREEGSTAFHRKWVKEIMSHEAPEEISWCRAYDKAAKEPSDENRYPDYTASVKIGKCVDGNYYIAGDYDEKFIDDPKIARANEEKVYGRFRKNAGERDRLIKRQAEYDGEDVHIVFAKDPGAAGQSEYDNAAKALIPLGYIVNPDPMPSNKSKFKRYEPFSSACENGFVYVLRDTFPNEETLNHFYKENEAFNGEPSTSARKDDLPDAVASGFNYIARTEMIPSFTLPKLDKSSTKITGLRQIT